MIHSPMSIDLGILGRHQKGQKLKYKEKLGQVTGAVLP